MNTLAGFLLFLFAAAPALGDMKHGSGSMTHSNVHDQDSMNHSDMQMEEVPADLNLDTERVSEKGHFVVSYTSSPASVPLNQLHSWTLHIETPEGTPVENAEINVSGDMPRHGHGLPTNPQVTEYLGNGNYLVEGMKFQMPGWWIVEFTLTKGDTTDQVTFNLLMQ